MTDHISCPLCGSRFDPSIVSCVSCPMEGACTLTCCPSCGYTTVDVGRSKSAGFIDRVIGRKPKPTISHTLLAVGVGSEVHVTGFAAAMGANHRELLGTYGIEPGRSLTIRQHKPVTVVVVDQTEVALDRELAAWVLVDRVSGTSLPPGE